MRTQATVERSASVRARGVERGGAARSDAAAVDLVTPDRRRVVIEGVEPCVDGGRFPIKRGVGEEVDGHGATSSPTGTTCWPPCCAIAMPGMATGARWRWSRVANDRWRRGFVVGRLGRYEYTVQAWVDRFATWQRGARARSSRPGRT